MSVEREAAAHWRRAAATADDLAPSPTGRLVGG
jgi:hypothetical protein